MSSPVPIGETLPWYIHEVKIFLSSIIAFIAALLVMTFVVGYPTIVWVVFVGALFVVYTSFMTMVVIRGARYRRRWHGYESTVAHFVRVEAYRGVAVVLELSNGHHVTRYNDRLHGLRSGDKVMYRRRIVRGREETTDFEIDHIRNQPAH
ncbi:MAG: hypothetical protein WBP12_05350 [Candidatus Saccharimonas sp.]